MYRVYIDGVLLPVAPDKIEVKIKSKNKKIMLMDLGEVNLLKTPGLSEIKFDILLPQTQYPFSFYEDGFKSADYYLNKLEDLKTSLKPFRFIVSRISPAGQLLFNTNIKVSIEEYSIKEDVKKYGLDVGVKIKLKQYRDYGTKILTLSEDGETATISEPRSAADIDEFYIVKEGDTLYEIARLKTGDGEYYTTLMELNSLSSPNDIEAGQVIRLV